MVARGERYVQVAGWFTAAAASGELPVPVQSARRCEAPAALLCFVMPRVRGASRAALASHNRYLKHAVVFWKSRSFSGKRSLLDRRLRASFKLAEDNAHLDDVESSVPSRQVLQDSYELLGSRPRPGHHRRLLGTCAAASSSTDCGANAAPRASCFARCCRRGGRGGSSRRGPRRPRRQQQR